VSINRRLGLVLVWALLMSGAWVPFNSTPDEQISRLIDQPDDLGMTNALSDEVGPSMRYYLRRYSPHFAQTLSSINLSIYIEDPAGVDTVLMMYSQKKGDSDNLSIATQDVGVWENLTMDYESEGWYEMIIPILNISEPNMWCLYLVKYAANDTLGNWSVSPLCIYVFTHSTTTADWFEIKLYDTPDLWYVAGTTNHTVTWDVAQNIHGQSGWPYYLYEDGYLVELWRWQGYLGTNVDGLALGDHIFELYLQVAFSEKSSDAVVVHVVETPEEMPPGVSTINVGPLTESDNNPLDLSIPIIVTGLAFVAVIIIWKKQST